jgi:DNA-binding transcriptional regulator YiaG
MSDPVKTIMRTAQAQQSLGDDPTVWATTRRAADVPVTQLADAVGCSTRTIHKWEKGQHRPSGVFLDRYVEIIESLRKIVSDGVSTDDLQ